MSKKLEIMVKTSLVCRAIELLEYYWHFKDKTPIDNDKEHENVLLALKDLRRKHGSIADRLYKAIEKSEFSASQLAKDCDIPYSTLNGWLFGSIPQDFDAVERLAEHLGVGFEYLLTGKETKNV